MLYLITDLSKTAIIPNKLAFKWLMSVKVEKHNMYYLLYNIFYGYFFFWHTFLIWCTTLKRLELKNNIEKCHLVAVLLFLIIRYDYSQQPPCTAQRTITRATQKQMAWYKTHKQHEAVSSVFQMYSVSEDSASVVALETKSARLERMRLSAAVVSDLWPVSEVLLLLMRPRGSALTTSLLLPSSSSFSVSSSLGPSWGFSVSELNWLRGFPRIPKLKAQQSRYNQTKPSHILLMNNSTIAWSRLTWETSAAL